MKIRNGFVSNSSSSSFIIQNKTLTEDQIKTINNFKNKVDEYNKTGKSDTYGDSMDINIEEGNICISAPYGSEGTIAMLLTIFDIKFEIGE